MLGTGLHVDHKVRRSHSKDFAGNLNRCLIDLPLDILGGDVNAGLQATGMDCREARADRVADHRLRSAIGDGHRVVAARSILVLDVDRHPEVRQDRPPRSLGRSVMPLWKRPFKPYMNWFKKAGNRV